MNTVHAIFEKGVFRPCEPVELPEGCEVEIDPRVVGPVDDNGATLSRIYETLGKRFDSGKTDVAERHNEHQP